MLSASQLPFCPTMGKSLTRLKFGFTDSYKTPYRPIPTEIPQGLFLNNAFDQVTLPEKHGLAPEEIPKFIVHGTSRNGTNMDAYVDYFKKTSDGQAPVYVCYIPEIEASKVIHRIDPKNGVPQAGQPSYIMLLRDMGDFRIQLFVQRFEELHKQLDSDRSKVHRQDVTRQFFQLPEAWPKRLVNNVANVINNTLLDGIAQVPRDLQGDFDESLEKLATRLQQKVFSEARKLVIEKEIPSIIDTSFFIRRLNAVNETLDRNQQWSLDLDYAAPNSRNAEGAKVVYLRSISLDEVAKFEAYGLFLENQLENNLRPILLPYFRRDKHSDLTPGVQLHQTAQHIMERLFPVGMVLGHSQGGFGVQATLLEMLQQMPEDYEEALSKKLQTVKDSGETSRKSLGTRFPNRTEEPSIMLLRSGLMMGFVENHAPPVKGMPSVQQWLESFFSRLERIVRLPAVIEWVNEFGWHQNIKGRHAMAEMREDSDTVKWLDKYVPSIQDKRKMLPEGLSVVNLNEDSDSIVPKASTGVYVGDMVPVNVFNWTLRLKPHTVPERLTKAQALTSVTEIFKQVPTLPSINFNRQPEVVRNWVYNSFCARSVANARQHTALISRPESVDRALPVFYLGHFPELFRVLQPGNFHPLQAQVLDLLSSVVRSGHPASFYDAGFVDYQAEDAAILKQATSINLESPEKEYGTIASSLVGLYYNTSEKNEVLRRSIVKTLESVVTQSEKRAHFYRSQATDPRKFAALESLILKAEYDAERVKCLRERIEPDYEPFVKRVESELEGNYEQLAKTLVTLYAETPEIDQALRASIVNALDMMVLYAERLGKVAIENGHNTTSIKKGLQYLAENPLPEKELSRRAWRISPDKKWYHPFFPFF